jgi:preprotein translocase subunit YajC
VYLLLIFVVVLLVFSMVQNNRRRKSTAAMQAAIEPGVRVMTTSGIYGIVQDVEPDSIVVEISEGVDVRFAKAAIMKVVPHLDDVDDADHLDDVDHLDDSDDGVEDGLDGGAADEAVDVRTEDNAVKSDAADRARVDGHQPGAGSVSTG